MLVRVGRLAIDTRDVRRIEDQGDKVSVVWHDGDRIELTGDDAVAARDLIHSLPTHLNSTLLANQFADEGGYVAGPTLSGHSDG